MDHRYRHPLGTPPLLPPEQDGQTHDGAPADGDLAEVQAPQSPVLTVEESADLLRLNRKTLLAAIDRGDIPGVRRVGRTIRIHRATLLQWFTTGQGQRPSKKRAR